MLRDIVRRLVHHVQRPILAVALTPGEPQKLENNSPGLYTIMVTSSTDLSSPDTMTNCAENSSCLSHLSKLCRVSKLSRFVRPCKPLVSRKKQKIPCAHRFRLVSTAFCVAKMEWESHVPQTERRHDIYHGRNTLPLLHTIRDTHLFVSLPSVDTRTNVKTKTNRHNIVYPQPHRAERQDDTPTRPLQKLT